MRINVEKLMASERIVFEKTTVLLGNSKPEMRAQWAQRKDR
jgi:hypothetical protein